MTHKYPLLIRIGFRLLNRLIDKDKNYGFFGDLEELYNLQSDEKGSFRATLWFWSQVLRSVASYIYDMIYWKMVMIRNYTKVTIRNMGRYKGYTFINIGGLAVGIASTLLIIIWVIDEVNFDKFHQNANNLYLIESDEIFSDRKVHGASSPVPLAPAIQKEIPEIMRATRCSRFGGIHVRYEDKIFFENIARAVDPDFFHMFTFPLIKGDINTVMSDPFSIVVTEEVAQKYFGGQNPIGKVLLIENKFELTVTGVMENIPDNSSIQFPMLVHFDFVNHQLERMPYGWGNAISSYVMLNDKSNINDVNRKITQLVGKHIDEQRQEYQLQPLVNLHLYSSYGPNPSLGSIRFIYIFLSIAFIVLTIACINFINLSTARSVNRSKEISMRKVVGAGRNNVISQFIGESFVFVIIALIIALILVLIFLPVFNKISWKNISIAHLSISQVSVNIVFILLFVTILAGGYPALFLSRFNPLNLLKNIQEKAHSNSLMRKILVITQFSLSIILLISTFVVYKQLDYMQNKDLGYNKDNIICIRMTGSTKTSYKLIKNALLKYPEISWISASGRRPSMNIDHGHNVDWDGKDPNLLTNIIFHTIDYDYIEMLDIDLIKGRGFAQEYIADTSDAFIINKQLASLIGADGKPVIGRSFNIFRMRGTIIGITKNFHHLSLRNEIEPMVMFLPPNPYWLMNILIKIKSNDMKTTMASIEDTWKEIVPDYPFEYSFLEEDFDRMYRVERRLGQLLNYFSIVAILIACLGLFGLIAYTITQRTKEIGIRKVMGAGIAQITIFIGKELILLVIVANIIAWPIAWIVLNQWLGSFAYMISLGWSNFIIAGFLVLFIAISTIGFQAIKAATSKPVKVLRYE